MLGSYELPVHSTTDERALEAMGGQPALSPTTPAGGNGCTFAQPCRFVDDRDLEAVGGQLSAQPTTPSNGCPFTMFGCPRIDDRELETAAGQFKLGPTSEPMYCTIKPFCIRIDDREMEASAGQTATPSQDAYCNTNPLLCRRIDDRDLEAASAPTRGPTGMSAGCPQVPSMPFTYCGPRIDDHELEAVGGQLSATPTSPSGGCPPTLTWCRHDDRDLEVAAVQASPGPSFNFNSCPTPPSLAICRARLLSADTVRTNA